MASNEQQLSKVRREETVCSRTAAQAEAAAKAAQAKREQADLEPPMALQEAAAKKASEGTCARREHDAALQRRNRLATKAATVAAAAAATVARIGELSAGGDGEGWAQQVGAVLTRSRRLEADVEKLGRVTYHFQRKLQASGQFDQVTCRPLPNRRCRGQPLLGPGPG
jgi:hypothetical protein